MATEAESANASWVDPGHSPKAIRSFLIDGDAEEFERRYRDALAAAAESFDLSEVMDLLAHWRFIAISWQDPSRHRQMLDTARRLMAGEDVPTVPWSVLKAKLGL